MPLNRNLFALLGALLFVTACGQAAAQTPIPARPLNPDQAISAPPVPSTPGVPSANGPDTNAPSAAASIPAVTVLADNSLKSALAELAQTWADQQPDGPQVPLTLTNAGTMRTQLESNPEWDVIISPDIDDVKAMTAKGLVQPAGQQFLARNTVVLYGRKALVKDDALDWFDLIGTEWNKVAMGDPDQTASGRVAKHALQKHDLDDADHRSLYVLAATEPRALQVAERDEADAVFVYKTDLMGVDLPGFEVFPISTEDAPPVFYTAVVGRLAKNPEGARSFIAFCASESAREIWTKYGFEMN
jgi:molybdate transport system substrate-binding protein